MWLPALIDRPEPMDLACSRRPHSLSAPSPPNSTCAGRATEPPAVIQGCRCLQATGVRGHPLEVQAKDDDGWIPPLPPSFSTSQCTISLHFPTHPPNSPSYIRRTHTSIADVHTCSSSFLIVLRQPFPPPALACCGISQAPGPPWRRKLVNELAMVRQTPTRQLPACLLPGDYPADVVSRVAQSMPRMGHELRLSLATCKHSTCPGGGFVHIVTPAVNLLTSMGSSRERQELGGRPPSGCQWPRGRSRQQHPVSPRHHAQLKPCPDTR